MSKPLPESAEDDESALISQWRERILEPSKDIPETTEEKTSAPADEDLMISQWRDSVEQKPAENPVEQPTAQPVHDTPPKLPFVEPVVTSSPHTGFWAKLRQRFAPSTVPPAVIGKLIQHADRSPEAADEMAHIEDIFQYVKVSRRKQRSRIAAKFLLAVLLPTFGVWYYVSNIAVPLYSAEAVISVTKPAPDSNAAGLGILGAVSGGGQMRDAFMVLEFLNSPAASEALERETGLISYYRDDAMDPVGRVRDLEALQISEAQSLGRYVKSSINVQNGLITTSIRARTREDALQFLTSMLTIAEAHMNVLSAGLFDERMAQANGAVERAQEAVQEAQRNMVDVQIANGEVDPQATIAGVYEAINTLEISRLELDRRILSLESADGAGSRILTEYNNSRDEVDQLIALQRARLVDASGGRSLNEKLAVHQTAHAAVLVAEQTLAAALAGRNEARQAAELGVSRFQIVVPPQAPQIADYPQRWQTTALAFFIFLSLLAIVSIAAPRSD